MNESMISTYNLQLGHLKKCQICASEELELILDMGHHPPCDSLLVERQLFEAEIVYPLRFLRCRNCGLAQIDYVVDPNVLFFPEYPYRSGITETLSRNLQSIAAKLVETLGLKAGSFVVDLGSNDGTILQGFKSQGMRVLGVEPTNIANIAIQNGIPTIQEFFGLSVAKKILEEYGRVSVVTAANMFAHVSQLGDLIRGVYDMLDDDGLFLTESHYLLDLLETTQYDSIYHEHLKFYSLKPIIHLFESHNFSVVDAERIPNYGGSIRVIAQKGKGRRASARLAALLANEESFGVYTSAPFLKFRDDVIKSKIDLQTVLLDIKNRGETVVGVGCPGRASTLLNYCNIDPVLMPYIAEQSTSLKLGMFLPGKHIPIVDEKRMFEENPDYVVMLSWHYSEPIINKLRQKGLKSKIILPLPEVKILES